VSVQETTPSALEPIIFVQEVFLIVKMSKKLKKPLKNQAHIPFVQLFSINLLSTFGECGGNFKTCKHDYDVCNDDKREC
jgi:hypothetical protein